MITTLLAIAALAQGRADTALRLPDHGAVEIHAETNDVTLHTTTGDMVTVHGGSADLDGRTIAISDRGHHGRSADGPLVVTVPASARVTISSISGDITVSGSLERLHAENINGDIRVDDGSGITELVSVAGDVTVNGFHGTSLSVSATSGDITVADAAGTIEADNVNGDVTLRDVRSNAVTAGTVNGAVQFSGDFAAGGTYGFTSQNDDVTLNVPVTVNARMRISTLNGSLDTQIPARTSTAPSTPSTARAGSRAADRGHDGERTFVVIYGSGGATVNVDAFNGNVIVKAAPK
jgi:DUF4097 and DUF4098 domain-containing protein YvlB